MTARPEGPGSPPYKPAKPCEGETTITHDDGPVAVHVFTASSPRCARRKRNTATVSCGSCRPRLRANHCCPVRGTVAVSEARQKNLTFHAAPSVRGPWSVSAFPLSPFAGLRPPTSDLRSASPAHCPTIPPSRHARAFPNPNGIASFSPGLSRRWGYPTQKPILLLERIIGLVTSPGGLVLDPFSDAERACVTLPNRFTARVGANSLRLWSWWSAIRSNPAGCSTCSQRMSCWSIQPRASWWSGWRIEALARFTPDGPQYTLRRFEGRMFNSSRYLATVRRAMVMPLAVSILTTS